MLFSGTLRSNLDPWDAHTDAQMWDAIAAAQLKSAVSAAGGLDASMAEAGNNLSVGQRQLLCLARCGSIVAPSTQIFLSCCNACVSEGSSCTGSLAGEPVFARGLHAGVLLCRALLQEARVLALDEATANVDRTTDAAIQAALRTATRGDERGENRQEAAPLTKFRNAWQDAQ